MKFSGFPRNVAYTPVPSPLLGPLLEQIGDLAELKVTLRALWLLHRKRAFPRYVTQEELLRDGVLLQGLGGQGRDPKEEIRRGLEQAVERGTLLLHRPVQGDSGRRAYLLNAESERRALARRGGDLPAEDDDEVEQPADAAEQTPGERPNIFALYEENVGFLSPMLAEELKEAEGRYPASWIYEAFKIAVEENKRSWRYVDGILRRWAAEGRERGRQDGEPGRYSQKDNRQKYLEEYQRRRGRLPWEPDRTDSR